MKGRNINPQTTKWPRVKLGELCDLVNGDAYRETDWSHEGVPIIRIQNLNNHNKPFNYWNGSLDDRVVVKPGDVLFAWSGTPGTSFGTHRWTRGIGVLNQHIFRVDLDATRIDPEWAVFSINEQLEEMIERAHGAVGLRHVTKGECESLPILLPSLDEQRRIAARLREQMAEAERARAAVQAQLDAAHALVQALLRESLKAAGRKTWRVPECLTEVTKGIGEDWSKFPVLGATRAGLAPAKENVGKNPGRYKPVTPGTVFYNPMRILLGSIAIVDEDDKPGITSPDYVAMRGVEGRLHATWFYHWFRSETGAAFIQSLTRGAVRERLLFNRLAAASITVPSWEAQLRVVAQVREIKKLRESFSMRLAEIERLPAALLRAAFNPN